MSAIMFGMENPSRLKCMRPATGQTSKATERDQASEKQTQTCTTVRRMLTRLFP